MEVRDEGRWTATNIRTPCRPKPRTPCRANPARAEHVATLRARGKSRCASLAHDTSKAVRALGKVSRDRAAQAASKGGCVPSSQLVFPDSQHSPARKPQRGVHPAIARHVAAKLASPERRVAGRP